MPLRTVYFATDCFYHVYNRGSEKRIIFQSSRDYTNFLLRVEEIGKKFAIQILCYCLMPNHFHLLIKQASSYSIAQFMNSLQLGYAKFFNTKYQRVGPLFQGRFKAKLLENEAYLLQLSAYIHRNPVPRLINPEKSRDLALSTLNEYPYSSYPTYIGRTNEGFIEKDTILSYFSKTNPNLTYQSFVETYKVDISSIASKLADIY